MWRMVFGFGCGLWGVNITIEAGGKPWGDLVLVYCLWLWLPGPTVHRDDD